jgi:hypothetical protein
MPHIHWVARQNKLEILRDKDEVNEREIHECDGRAHDADTMVAPLTPKPTHKAESLAKVRKWSLPRYCCASCILETRTKVGSTSAKAPALRTNPKIDEAPTAPKSPTHPSHPQTLRPSTPSSSLGSTSSSILPNCRVSGARGVRVTLTCYNCREYGRCEKPQEAPIHLTKERTTMHVCFQEPWNNQRSPSTSCTTRNTHR